MIDHAKLKEALERDVRHSLSQIRRKDLNEAERIVWDSERRKVRERKWLAAQERQGEVQRARHRRLTDRDLTKALIALEPFIPTLLEWSEEKARKAARYLGGADDIAQSAVVILAKLVTKRNGEWSLEALAKAAEVAARKRPPVDKEERKAARWICQRANNAIKEAIRSWYRANMRNRATLSRLDTVLANIDGIDETIDAHCAARAPKIVGTAMPRPQGFRTEFLQIATNAFIRERGLDDVTEIILDNIRADGRIPWTTIGWRLWRAMGLDPAIWRMIPKKKRKKAIQTAVRNRYIYVAQAMVAIAEHEGRRNASSREIVVGVALDDPIRNKATVSRALEAIA